MISRHIENDNGTLRFTGIFDDYKHGRIVTCSPEMEYQLDILDKVAASDVTVLINGESGTGKELYAEYTHLLSNRKDKRYIKLNCATLSPSLFESEMFGYEPGSFTGALNRGKKGVFEIADGGTVFLDEVSSMPISVQPKLLRVLQDGKYTKVGGYDELSTDVRIIAASNRDLTELFHKGDFREDLYYRLNVVSVNLLPLRQRVEDIALLAFYFLEMFNKKYETSKRLGQALLEELMSNNWPGNIRELQHTIERMVLLSSEETLSDISVSSLSMNKKNPSDISVAFVKRYCEGLLLKNYTLPEIVAEIEKTIILSCVEKHGSLRICAKILGVSASTLSRKLSEKS
jgi:transcriptional regulator with PAS, ATPase and Fis domain